MKKILLFLLFVSLGSNAQVIVNNEDLNEKTEVFEVYLMAKPFNTKESIFVDSGSNNFRLNYYDSKMQFIANAEGKKFEKGDYLNLYKYLTAQGWEEGKTREVTLGTQKGSCIMFKKKKA